MILEVEHLLSVGLGDFVWPLLFVAFLAAPQAVNEDGRASAALTTEDAVLLGPCQQATFATEVPASCMRLRVLQIFEACDIGVSLQPMPRPYID